ncbi:SoxR reducing system RseC family protein [Pseudoflavonifractor phocaeensis]|uniref:SoxR reducing system RseC family protein n=1 Tax=Pseudoflavonifractor phocaeensis TaxID=1870988 RepID=UPI0019598B00|nr:SoxR reducing system RseC family protein [Pseudoflavonifractor phocaeensis]MBM6869581.1 SoxR reducing system RseC family protein [Pseudoflavonifractor phocaeensis]MBM6938585.1 SoxR reducing system RseC family protein [Pseudoflavonifractor phocaeensis]
MVQTARVKRLLADGRAEVAVPRKSACGHDCSQCGGGCSEMLVQMEVTTVAANPVQAEPGDTVRVESDSKGILRIAAVVYLVPFLLFFVGYYLVGGLFGSESGAIAAAIAGFLLGLCGAVLLDRQVKRSRQNAFRITEILRG